MTDPQLEAQRAAEPVFRIPGVVLVLLSALLAVHAGLVLAGPDWQVLALYLFSFIPSRISGAAAYPAVWGSQVWSWLTYALLHGGWVHLLSNCLWLTVFGTVTGRRLSAFRFLVVFAAGVIGGAAAMLVMYWGQDILLVGASAGISALMAAAIPLMYSKDASYRVLQSTDLTGLRALRPGELITDTRALFFTLLWFGLPLLTGVAGGGLSNSFADADRIAWEAHVGGFIAGIFAFYLLDKQPDLRGRQS